MDAYIAVGSLTVAALALIVSPLSAWYVAKYQADSSRRVAVKQLIAPMRQKWIDDLRNRVAELISVAHWFFRLNDKVNEIEVEQKALFLTRQIQLMLNPDDGDHQELVRLLGHVVNAGLDGKDVSVLQSHVAEATVVCQAILKREWERVKKGDL
jgi:hypothetical protein